MLHTENEKSSLFLKKQEVYKNSRTPEKSDNEVYQQALNWWHELPIQDIRDCKLGWANLVMKHHPEKTNCYNLTEREIYNIWKYENNITTIKYVIPDLKVKL